MDIKESLRKLTNDLGHAAMVRVKQLKKNDGHHVHVVVLAVEFLPPDGTVGTADACATFTDNKGLEVMASVMHDLYMRKSAN